MSLPKTTVQDALARSCQAMRPAARRLRSRRGGRETTGEEDASSEYPGLRAAQHGQDPWRPEV